MRATEFMRRYLIFGNKNKDDDSGSKKKKSKKKRFDLFKKVKKKRSDQLKSRTHDELLDDIVDELMDDLEFIPPVAFDAIDTYEENSHLKSGLYVSRSKLLFDDRMGAALGENEEDDKRKVRNHGDTYGDVDWFESKILTKRFGGKIMTPAEYFCIENYLFDIGKKRNKGQDRLYFDMTEVDSEWLDCIVFDDVKFRVHDLVEPHFQIILNSEIEGKKVKDGIRIELHDSAYDSLSYENYFYRRDVDPRTGFPGSLETKSGEFFYIPPSSYISGVCRTKMPISTPGKGYTLWQPSIDASRNPYSGYDAVGFRVCYRKEDLDGGDAE